MLDLNHLLSSLVINLLDLNLSSYKNNTLPHLRKTQATGGNTLVAKLWRRTNSHVTFVMYETSTKIAVLRGVRALRLKELSLSLWHVISNVEVEFFHIWLRIHKLMNINISTNIIKMQLDWAVDLLCLCWIVKLWVWTFLPFLSKRSQILRAVYKRRGAIWDPENQVRRKNIR